MSTWLFDAGNTRLKFRDATAVDVQVLAYDAPDFEDQLLRALPARAGFAAVASVVAGKPPLQLLDLLARRFRRIGIARTVREMAGLRIAYETPAHLGVDRFLTLLALHAQRPASRVIVSVGTALTVDWLLADGTHKGGRIAPSPTLMRQSLAALSQALPASGGAWTLAEPFTDDTVHALASGCEGAAVALIRASAEIARAREPATTVELHGGGAEALLALLPDAVRLPDDIVLQGLKQYFMP